MGNGSVSTRGFVTLSNVSTDQLQAGHSSEVSTKVGGRVDWRQKVNDVNFVVSGTDATARDYESVPQVKDAVITADTNLNDLSVGLGFDTGTQGVLASIGTSEGLTGTNVRVGGKDVTARAWWFQKGNVVRSEATVNLDLNTKLWGAYTFNSEDNTANRTFVNIKEREGFIIEPFTSSIANAAVAISHTRDDYIIDAAYDINRNAPFLSVGKRQNDKTAIKVGYAFKDEVALLEVAHKHNDDLPAIRAFVKAPAGANGVGKPSGGVILDKYFDL